MRADDAALQFSARGSRAQIFQRAKGVFTIARKRCGQYGGNAVAEVIVRRPDGLFRRAEREVRARRPVRVRVDKARRKIVFPDIEFGLKGKFFFGNGRDHAVFVIYVSGKKFCRRPRFCGTLCVSSFTSERLERNAHFVPLFGQIDIVEVRDAVLFSHFRETGVVKKHVLRAEHFARERLRARRHVFFPPATYLKCSG